MRRVQGNWIAMLVVSACGLLGACSHDHGDASTPLLKRHSGSERANARANSADTGPTDLVSAVSAGGADEGPVGLKFQLGQRPVAGQPVVVTLRLVANQPLEHLEARFRTDDGLDVSQGGDFDPEGQMEAGAVVDHALTLVPAREGVYTVMATVTAGSTAEAVSRSFTIPIVVASSAPPPSAPAAKHH